jgi:hypothetical protein
MDNIDSIKASIKIILSWPLRTRQFNGEFGSRIHEAIEDQNDDVLVTLIRRFVIDAINKWEKRIELSSLIIDRPTTDSLVVNLIYLVKDLDIHDSLLYTYYIN